MCCVPYAYYYGKVNRFCIVKIYVQWNDIFKIRTLLMINDLD